MKSRPDRVNPALGSALALMVMGLAPSCGQEDQAVTVPSFRGTATELTAILQRDHVPVSIIQSVNEPSFELHEGRVRLHRLLEKVVELTGVYRSEWIDGRAVLYPRAPPYDREIGGVEISDVPRFDAAAVYLRLLRTEVPGIPLILGPVKVIAGAPGRIPLYDDPVTLESSARVIDHLVQLMGSDRSLFFIIKQDPGLTRPVGAMLLQIGSVDPQ